MNVLIIPSWYPRRKAPGVGVFFRDFAMMMKEAGVSVYVADVGLLPNRDFIGNQVFRLYQYEDCGLHVLKYKIPSIFGLRIDTLEERLVRSCIAKTVEILEKKGITIDIVHAHAFRYAGISSVRYFRNKSIPVIVTEHSSDVLNGKKTCQHFDELAREAYTGAAKVYAVSSSLAEVIRKNYHTRCEWMPNCYDDSIFSYAGETERQTDCFEFVCVANLLKGKRILNLVKAFAEVSERHNKVRLTVVGEGSEYDSIQAEIENLRLKNKVSLTGYQNKTRIVEILKRAHCFVLPSAFETFGIAYVEAMAMGLPVIATYCGGPESFVTIENGILIPVDDHSELVKAMIFMINNIAKYNRAEIAGYVKNRFSKAVVGREMKNAYEEMSK